MPPQKILVSREITFLLNEEIPKLPPAARLPHFLKNWEKLTTNPKIINLVQGIIIPFLSLPEQLKEPKIRRRTQLEHGLIKREIEKLLKKGAIEKAEVTKGQFISSLFLVPKKEGGTRPVINLKPLNQYIPYHKFRLETIGQLRKCWNQAIT